MSARSMRRARAREERRERRRAITRARRIGIGAGGALAALFAAPAAADAATFTVTTTADTDGPACVAGDSDCSLREAIRAANANGADDVINFASGVTGTINLQFGHLQIRNEGLEIQGPGASQLTINGADQDRIFKLFGFDAADEQVVIDGLTLTDGDALDNPFTSEGGAILSLDGSFTEGSDFDFGAPANLTVSDSVIKDSAAHAGGAIANTVIDSASAGALTVRNSTLNNNTAVFGGGIWATQVNKPITVEASTVSNNRAVAGTTARAPGFVEDGDGGGLAVNPGTGAVVVSNSTFARNSADAAGGAMRFVSQPGNPRSVRNSTVADNSAGQGGGISVSQEDTPDRGVNGSVEVGLSSTIAADNSAGATAGDADGPDLRSDGASFNAGFSLLESTAGATVNAAPPGSNVTGLDPLLGPLADNGGPTQTKLPATSSAAIDAGVANALTGDQRGLPRTVDRSTPNATGSDATDIGAVELAADAQPGPPKPQRCLGEVLLVKRGANEGERIEGTPERDGVFARGGNDDVFGLGDRDCLFGGPGGDGVDGGPDDDYVAGDPDDDTVRGNGGNDDVRGQHGDDRVFGGPGGDKRVTGGTGNDKVFGGAGADTLIKGDSGNDELDLGAGKDFAHAGGGQDEVHSVDGQVDTIVCGAGRHDVAFADPGDAVNRDCETVNIA